MPTLKKPDLGRLLRSLREARGLTVAEVAAAIRYDRVGLHHIEAGKGLSSRTLTRLLDHYGADDATQLRAHRLRDAEGVVDDQPSAA